MSKPERQEGQQNPCPNCQRMQTAGKYTPHEVDTPEGKRIAMNPPDVLCECGATLRHTVPLFHQGNGWKWRIVKPAGGNPKTLDEIASV